MAIIGGLIALGAALVFLVVAALTLFGATNATQRQLMPGFLPDQPSQGERLAALLGLWLPALLVTMLCLLAGIQIFRVGIGALLL